MFFERKNNCSHGATYHLGTGGSMVAKRKAVCQPLQNVLKLNQVTVFLSIYAFSHDEAS